MIIELSMLRMLRQRQVQLTTRQNSKLGAGGGGGGGGGGRAGLGIRASPTKQVNDFQLDAAG